ncbi:uncharacterized protein EDB91DRAFT_1124924 [Suillus paluster]|uniref:uncharacterized protein n=1 Tax=Suillus paluster TaxID=48578 RepID=UPI001B85FE36|nr:uncharacterized protein EDB91DRAFT_1124924 [Suillus paluster]KAG1743554.1 hypothetical protein EDB91DRAFT_1124924 [Suillus paluster]
MASPSLSVCILTRWLLTLCSISTCQDIGYPVLTSSPSSYICSGCYSSEVLTRTPSQSLLTRFWSARQRSALNVHLDMTAH